MSEGRQAAEDRIDGILGAAARLIVQRHSIDFGMNDLAVEIGVSRALIYTYFQDPAEIMDALAYRHLARLDQQIRGCCTIPDFTGRMLAILALYHRDLVDHGPVLPYILRERKADSPLTPRSLHMFAHLVRHIASQLRAALRLPPREALVFLELLSAMPEQLAELQRQGSIAGKTAEATLGRLARAIIADMHVRQG